MMSAGGADANAPRTREDVVRVYQELLNAEKVTLSKLSELTAQESEYR